MNITTNGHTCIEDKIGYNFKNRELLEEAFTHRSYNPTKNNEILEFKGDKILNATIGFHLSEKFDLNEGMLTKLTSYFVDNKSILPKLCIKHGFDELISISDYEKNTKNSRENWIPSLLEALIGAVFIDCEKNWSITEKVVLRLYEEELILDEKRIEEILHKYDPISLLKEYCDECGCKFEIGAEKVDGLDNDPVHVGYVRFDGNEHRGDMIKGSKQKAKENVCEKIINTLQLNNMVEG